MQKYALTFFNNNRQAKRAYLFMFSIDKACCRMPLAIAGVCFRICWQIPSSYFSLFIFVNSGKMATAVSCSHKLNKHLQFIHVFNFNVYSVTKLSMVSDADGERDGSRGRRRREGRTLHQRRSHPAAQGDQRIRPRSTDHHVDLYHCHL